MPNFWSGAVWLGLDQQHRHTMQLLHRHKAQEESRQVIIIQRIVMCTAHAKRDGFVATVGLKRVAPIRADDSGPINGE